MKDQFQKWSRLVLPDHDFAAKLVDLILKCMFTRKVKKSKSLSARYERMWRCFHQFASSSELTTLWMQGLGNQRFKTDHIHLVACTTRRCVDTKTI